MEIARLANVSQSAVSRVLTGRAEEFGVPPEVAERVRKIAAGLAYKPNLGAHMMRGRQTKLIGVVVRSFEDRYLATVLDELNSRALQAGYVLLVVGFQKGEYDVREIRLLESYRPDACIVVGSAEFDRWDQDFLTGNKLVLQIGMPVEDKRIVTCGSDEAEATKLLVQHLAKLGHESVGIVGDCTQASRVRLSHLRATIRDAKNPIALPCIYQSEYASTEAGVDAANYLLSNMPRKNLPTAIIATGDMIALAMLRALMSAGLRVPQDISLASYGDIDFASLVTPTLTSVHHPLRLMAATSMDIVTGALPRQSVLLPVELRERESTGPAPKA